MKFIFLPRNCLSNEQIQFLTQALPLPGFEVGGNYMSQDHNFFIWKNAVFKEKMVLKT